MSRTPSVGYMDGDITVVGDMAGMAENERRPAVRLRDALNVLVCHVARPGIVLVGDSRRAPMELQHGPFISTG